MGFDRLLQQIENAKIITIFRHTNPDCDAVGSQFGLKNWIQDNYPDKQVYALGYDAPNQGVWPKSDETGDEVIAQSFAIVVDTANTERIDDQRFASASSIFKIDHHPDRSFYGDDQIVDESAAATCQILADFLAYCKESRVSVTTAERLYAGMLTDTLNFTTSNTTAASLRAAGYLCQFGVDIPSLSRTLFDRSLNGFRFSAWIRSNVTVQDGHLGYAVIPMSIMEEYDMSASKARSFVDEYGHVREFEAWCVFTEKQGENGSLYDGSLRSKTIRINDIAEKYHGGGHVNASGVKNLTRTQVDEILDLINKRIHV